jgi:hypothetical protein
MRYVAWILICLLVVLHQCTLPWQSKTLWLGFIPGVLGYHVVISLATAGAWALVVKFAWPADLDTPPAGKDRAEPVMPREDPGEGDS